MPRLMRHGGHRRRLNCPGNAGRLYCQCITPSEEKQVGHSEEIMRTLMLALRATLPRWRSRPSRAASGAPSGPRSVDAAYHTAASMDLASHLCARLGSPLHTYGPVYRAASPEPAAMAGGARARGGRVGTGPSIYWFGRVLCGTVVRASTLLLSACSTGVVILASAGTSAAFELNQVRTTHYGWLNNRCGSGNAMPGDCISTKGQTQSFRANISSDGSFEHPTTLAVPAHCLHGRPACPITRSGYLRSGDLVFVPDLGWFKVEDTCGTCEAGAIAFWTATASGTGLSPGQLDQSRPTIYVFHPQEPIPEALKVLRANPGVWRPLVWTSVQHMTDANATSLFVDLHLKRIPASVPARSTTPAETSARLQDAPRPADPTRPVQPRPQDPTRPQEAEAPDGSAAVDWLLKGRR